ELKALSCIPKLIAEKIQWLWRLVVIMVCLRPCNREWPLPNPRFSGHRGQKKMAGKNKKTEPQRKKKPRLSPGLLKLKF
ncbi:MAG: hypothetical protein ACXWC9_06100, partial [Pseudobdellovibrionaceae bacterium]